MHPTLAFLLLLRIVGIVLVAYALFGLGYAVLHLRAMWSMAPGTARPDLWFLEAAGSVVQLGLGMYLLFGGRWLARKCVPPGLRVCAACGDLVSGAPCSTCGDASPVEPKSTDASDA